MDFLKKFKFQSDQDSEVLAKTWFQFLTEKNFDFNLIEQIDFTTPVPKIYDSSGNKFSIDFLDDRQNYHKKKASMKKELIGRAMGGGRHGIKILDLSAGLGIDAIFLSQLGFEVTALERNPLIYLALHAAGSKLENDLRIKFIYESSQSFLTKSTENFDVIYFDPMFPEKLKSALPRQEMVFFRNLVGDDADADQVLELALVKKHVQRVVVKRPIKAPILCKRPQSQLEGKLIRFDVYRGAL